MTDDFEDLFEQRFPGGQLWSQVDHMLCNDGFLRRFTFDRQGLAHAEEFRFNASWAQEAVNENTPDAVDATLALCWFDDRPAGSAGTRLLRDDIPSLEVKELGVAFRQLNDPPPRP